MTPGCPPRSHHKKGEDRDLNRVRVRRYRANNRPQPPALLAWDGEGWENAGRHVYGYFANSDGSERYNRTGLSTCDCLNFLVDEGRGRRNVMFSISYDAIHILMDLTREQAQDAMDDDKGKSFVKGCHYKNFFIQYVPRKYLYVRRDTEKTGVRLWDIYGFYQSPFTTALEKWFGKEYPELPLIYEGKGKRSVFDPADIEFIRKYNSAELRATVALSQSLISATEEAGLHLTRYDGAGAVAAAMLKKADMKKRVFLDTAGNRVRLPLEMRNAAEIGYVGGRIEMLQYGTTHAPVYHYDINSAYPAALIGLPNAGRGVWHHVDFPVFDDCPKMTLFRVKWDVKNERICPFPYRSRLQRKMLYPPAGESWVWYPEVLAAMNTQRAGWKVSLLEAWVFEPECPDDRPYAFIQEYYDMRKALVAESKRTGRPGGAEKVIKLGLNSLYGKTAQRTGSKPYHSLAYAGYITSAVRAQVYTAAMQAPEDIISIATDGIYSLVPLDLPCPSEKVLGLWEFTRHDSMISIQSGHYLLNDADEWLLWSRGFDRIPHEGATEEERSGNYQEALRGFINRLFRAWKKGEDCLYLPCSRICTLKSALQGDRWEKRGQWIPGFPEDLPGKQLMINPELTKRETDLSWAQPNPADGMVKTVPALNLSPGAMSAPYRMADEADDQREKLFEASEECLIR